MQTQIPHPSWPPLLEGQQQTQFPSKSTSSPSLTGRPGSLTVDRAKCVLKSSSSFRAVVLANTKQSTATKITLVRRALSNVKTYQFQSSKVANGDVHIARSKARCSWVRLTSVKRCISLRKTLGFSVLRRKEWQRPKESRTRHPLS